MNVRVLAFARVRELLPASVLEIAVRDDACVADVWNALEAKFPGLRELAATTRIARNGRLAAGDEPLADDDELALLPPVGGG